MTRIDLLQCFRALTAEAIGDIIMPTQLQKDDVGQEFRAAEVHLMRLPDSSAAKKKSPYIIHQLITGKDSQNPGSEASASAVIRSIFSVYNGNEEEGSLMLINLMERLRIRLLKQVLLERRYQLDLSAGLEILIYPNDTAPFYAGEMVSTWMLPAIKREVDQSWQ